MSPEELKARWQRWRFNLIRKRILAGEAIASFSRNGNRLRKRVRKLADDLRGIDLSASVPGKLVHYNFSHTDLSHADLSGCDLSHADLSGCDLTSANLHGASLMQAKLISATLAEVDALDANLTGADCRNANFYGARLIKANLQKADLRDSRFENAVLHGVRLDEAKVRDSSGFVQKDLGRYRWMPDVLKVGIFRVFSNPVAWKAAIRDEREGDFRGAVAVYFQLYEIVTQAGRKDDAGELFYRWRCCMRKAQKARWSRLFDSVLKWWLIGYGERIWRPLFMCFAVIIIFGLLYSRTADENPGYYKASTAPACYVAATFDTWDWMCYSAVIFSTLGYEDICPNFVALAATEAMLRAVLIPIFATVVFRKLARS